MRRLRVAMIIRQGISGMGGADFIRDMGGGFADQLQVAQGGVVGQSARLRVRPSQTLTRSCSM
jgi:hypothetical protein